MNSGATNPRYVIDASVWVADQNRAEKGHQDSRAFLRTIRSRGEAVICPTLCTIEVVAAIVCPTGNRQFGKRALRRVRHFPNIEFAELTLPRQRRTERTAAALRLRGADAVYVALAREFGVMLITWDVEVLKRTSGTVAAMTPTDWLASPPPVAV